MVISGRDFSISPDLGLEVGDRRRVAVGGAGPGLELLGEIALAVAGGCGFSHAGGMTADTRLLQPKAHDRQHHAG
ncbi:MAG: hypothetical protein WAL72_34775 [Streptosporangiaceae bacterium]